MKERLTRNIGMKIISILLAIVIWICINGLIDPVVVIKIEDIPVKVLNEDAMTSENKIFEVVSGDKVTIKIRGKRSIVEELTTADFEATADLTTRVIMEAVEIKVVCLTHSETEVEIVEKLTNVMKLTLEDSDTQSYAVSVIPDGTVADGFYVAESIASPNLITISGSKTTIGKIAKIAVLVDVNKANGSFELKGQPVVYDKSGNIVDSAKLEMSAQDVSVAVKLLPTKDISIRVAPTGTPFYDYACTGVEFAPNTITLAGEESDLKRISYLELMCDISSAREDVETDISIEEALTKRYGDKFIIVNESKEVTVKATIVKMQTKEISLLTSNIETRSLPEGLIAAFSAMTASVKVVGLTNNLVDVTAVSLKPYIDCSSFAAAGTYRAVIQSDEYDNVDLRLATVEVVVSAAPEVVDAGTEEETEAEILS